jgi:hypothetical protein
MTPILEPVLQQQLIPITTAKKLATNHGKSFELVAAGVTYSCRLNSIFVPAKKYLN